MQLELIAPVKGESIYTEFLDRGGPGLHHICVEAADTRPSTPRSRPPNSRGHRSSSRASCPAACGSPTCPPRGRRALYRDRAHPARNPGVLRLRETGAAVTTEIPETRQRRRRDELVRRVRRRGHRLRHRRWLRGRQRRGRRGAGAGAGARRRGRRHHLDGRRAFLPRRRHRRAAGHRPPRQPRGDVQVPRRGVARTRARQDPRVLRGQRRALQLVGGLGFSVRAQLSTPKRRSSSPTPRA